METETLAKANPAGYYAAGGYVGGLNVNPPGALLGRITVGTVQIVDGWIGQILVDGKPIWQSVAFDESDIDVGTPDTPRELAQHEAEVYAAGCLAAVFA